MTVPSHDDVQNDLQNGGMADYLDVVRRAADVLGNASAVTWISVVPTAADDLIARAYVHADHPDYVRRLADLPDEEKPGGVPAFRDHPTDPTWAGRINDIWLHVAVDFDERPAS